MTSKKATILQIIGGGETGGSKSQLLALIGRLQENYRVKLVCLLEGPVAQEARKLGYDVQVFPMKAIFDLRAIFWLKAFITREAIDLVHTHGVRANFCGRLAARWAGKAIVTTVHSSTKHDYVDSVKRYFYTTFDNLTLAMAHRLIAVSGALAQELHQRGAAQDKVIIIPNGIELALFDSIYRQAEQPLAGTDAIVGTVGRLVGVKDQKTFLAAAAIVLEACPKTKFYLVGDGPLREALELQAKELNLTEHVVFTGYRRDIPELMAKLDIFVLSSLMEGLPITLLEAMALGRPVVVTQVGGMPEVVKDGQTGYLVPTEAPLLMAEAILKILTNPGLGAAMGESGRREAEENYTFEHMADRYSQQYEELLRLGQNLFA